MRTRARVVISLSVLLIALMLPRPAVGQDASELAKHNLGSGLAVGVSMEATANWNADQTWTAPLLFQVSKVTLLGKRPVNLAVAAGPMVASPDGKANWRFDWRPLSCFRGERHESTNERTNEEPQCACISCR